VRPDLDYEHEREEKLELVALDWVPLRAGWLSYLHILRAIPNYTRFSVGESLVVCCGRDSARAGSIPRLWQTADLSGQNLGSSSGRARHFDIRFLFLHILLRTAAGSAFDRSAASWAKSSRIHVVGSRWEGRISQRPHRQIESRRANFLSRFLVTIV
jgi:hypothetical protein